MNIEQDIKKILITEEEIDKRCRELGKHLSEDYDGLNPVVICLLKGSVVFTGKLITYINVPMELECLRIKSYDGMHSTGHVQIFDFDYNILNKRHVIIVEDIIDTGLTLKEVIKIFKTKSIKSLEVCALLNKKAMNRVDINPKYIGFEIPNEFVVGFGLDYNQQYRNLPYVGVLKEEAINK